MTERVLTSDERFRSLAATIVAMGVTAAIYSLTLPLFATRLDAMGHSELVIGINTAAQSVALLAIAPLTPRLLRRFGAAQPMVVGFVATIVFMLLCPLFENAWFWLIMRLLIGMSLGVLWISGEAWVNQVSDDTSRGRNLAIYGMAGAVGTMAGFGLIFVIGHADWTPFLVMAGLSVICLMVISPAVNVSLPFQGETSHSLFRIFLVAPTPMVVNLLVAITFGSLSTFVAIYVHDLGLTPDDAYLLLVLLSVGGILQYPVGWLADRVNHRALAGIVLIFMVIMFAVMNPAISDPLWRWPYAAILGTGMMSLYTLGLIMLGARFRGADLGAATTVFQITFNAGLVAGPFVVGFAMEKTGAGGLPWTLAVCYVVVILFALMRGRSRAT